MSTDSEFKDEWAAVLRLMIQNFRKANPDDKRSDQELLTSLMDYFVKRGGVKKRDGKYVLPKIDDPDGLIAILREFSEASDG